MAATATTRVGGGPGYQGPKLFTAAGNPTVDNDGINGYGVGDQILNTVTLLLWTCVDVSTGAAVWRNAAAVLTLPPGASTAAAGTTTADAGVLPAGTASVYPTTAADDTKGVRVHATDKVTGRTIFIGNGVSNKILKVYAPSGGAINGASADAAFSSASGKGVVIHCLDSTANTWLAW